MNPKVSIIIPTYNNLKNLRLCIDSIKKQTFLNYEVWIIDGASTDKTIDFLNTLKAPFFWKSEKDTGIYSAMNKGVFLAKGDWLYFLGADDEIAEKTTLKEVFDVKIPKITTIISGKITYKAGGKPFIYSKKNRIKYPSWNFSMWIRNGLHHQGTFYKKELFSTLNFNESYQVLADYALNLRFYKEKKTCYVLSQKIAICGTEGISKNKNWKMYKEEILLKKKNSFVFFTPVFYIISWLKFSLSKIINYA